MTNPQQIVMRPCRWCGKPFPTRECIRHQGSCPERQRVLAKSPRSKGWRVVTCKWCSTEMLQHDMLKHLSTGCQTVPRWEGCKFCAVCQEPKAPENFYSDPRKRDGLSSECRDCNASLASMRSRTPEAVEKRRWDLIWKNYKLTKEQYEQIYGNQNGRCGICRKTPSGGYNDKRLHIDHDHGPSKKVRGLLCKKCNHGMGQFHDDPVLLFAALYFLIPHWSLGTVS